MDLGRVYKDDDHRLVAIVGLYRFDDAVSQLDTRAAFRFLTEHTGHQLESIREFRGLSRKRCNSILLG